MWGDRAWDVRRTLLAVCLLGLLVAVGVGTTSLVLPGDTSVRPTAEFAFEYYEVDENPDGTDWGLLVVRHVEGDSPLQRNVYLRGPGFNGSRGACADGDGTDWQVTEQRTIETVCEEWAAANAPAAPSVVTTGRWPQAAATGFDRTPGTATGDLSPHVRPGDSVTVAVAADCEVLVVYEPLEAQSSTIMDRHTCPNGGDSA